MRTPAAASRWSALKTVQRDTLLASSLGPVSFPFSICSLETAVTPHKQRPPGVVTRECRPFCDILWILWNLHFVPRIQGRRGCISEAQIACRNLPRVSGIEQYISPLFSPLGSKQQLTQRRMVSSRGGVTWYSPKGESHWFQCDFQCSPVNTRVGSVSARFMVPVC